jgi:hypothetical protein
MERQERCEHAHREDSEQELTAVTDVLIDDEPAERPCGDGEERHEGKPAAHMRIFVDRAAAVRSRDESTRRRADITRMIWPVAALAVFLLGFVVVYGSRLQARLETRATVATHEDSGVDLDIA